MMLRRILQTTVFIGLLAHMPVGFALEPSAELAQFDEDAARCRRVVRQYCAVAQNMMKGSQEGEAPQEEGLALLRDARGQWEDIVRQWGENPPEEYAADTQFKMRLEDFSNALEDMETALAAGKVRRSFMACSFGCGLFVTMHEENGLTYPLDKLFHMRKAMKTAGAVMKARGLDAVRSLTAGVMQRRDVVLSSSLPWPAGDPRNDSYEKALFEASSVLDAWVFAVAAGDSAAAESSHQKMTALINTAYGLAL